MKTRDILLTSVAISAIACNASALPQGADVVSGGITVSQTAPNQLVINQSTSNAIINWQSFDILTGEITRFIQPSSSAIALNRIKSGSPTEILGELLANGRVVIVNPNGVFFGPGSRIDVAGLIASTADIRNKNFLAGNYKFDRPGSATASIINEGHITARDSGLVALVAPGVRNDGVITAKYGTIDIGAARSFTVDFYGDGLYGFAVGRPAAQANVTNTGKISAQGGTIYVTARAAKDMVDDAINSSGLIEATAAHLEGGSIVLDGEGGDVTVTGKIDASGKKSGQTGGTVDVLGNNITLTSTANIDASGAAGGGNVNIGGGLHGQGKLPHAASTTVAAGSVIDVSALDNGNGGTAVVWSDRSTNFDGTILGKGGANGGNGGNAEISSAGNLALGKEAMADLYAPHGKSGAVLLDPADFVIDSAAAGSMESMLNSGSDVNDSAANDVDVDSSVVWNGAGSLSLTAGHDVNVNASIESQGSGSISLTASNNVNEGAAGNVQVSSAGGNVTIGAGNVTLTNGSTMSAGGALAINNTGAFSSDTAGVLSGNSVALNQNGGSAAGSIQNAINAVGTTGSGGATLTLGAGTWDETLQISQANFTLTGSGQGVSIIQPTSSASAPIINVSGGGYIPAVLAQGAGNITITNLTVDGTQVSVPGWVGILYNNAGGAIGNVTITQNSNGVGAVFNNASSLNVANNIFTGGGIGLYSNDSNGLTLSGNSFSGENGNVGINGGSGIVVTGNNFTAAATVAEQGISVNASDGIIISNNTFSGVPDSTAIIINDSDGATIASNTVLGGYSGIILTFSNGDNLTSNTLSNNTNSILMVGANAATVSGNGIDSSHFGIAMSGGSNYTISNNQIANTDLNINASNANGLLISGNTLGVTGSYGFNSGIGITGGSNATIMGNSISGTSGIGTGISLSGVTGTNAITNANSVSNFATGIELNNTPGVSIDNAMLNNNSVGLFALGNSGGTSVASTQFLGGTTGVVLSGGATLSFADNNSSFTSPGFFTLENGAMNGQILDASGQIFNNVRASDFSPDLLQDAENATIDSHNSSGVGTVFYTSFSPSTPVVVPTADITQITQQIFEERTITHSLFSYSGHTIASTVLELPYNFRVQDVNLSLLLPVGGGRINLGQATPQQLGNLAPSAGGDAAQLAALEPTAGANLGCGNEFLGSGYALTYNPATCGTR